ncbi:MAG: hypothetical protein DMG13_17170 [Acidobacteria bacterium]|nr:MAG: hypothetical protein DMG13_17170 [Acidobacteriota bacterium]
MNRGAGGLVVLICTRTKRPKGRQRCTQPLSLVFEQVLAQQLGRPLLDKTGLNSRYTFELTFTPDPVQGM